MTAPLTFEVDASQAKAVLGNLATQIPYTMSRAINDTAFQFRDIVRGDLPSRFVVRRPAFIKNQIQVTHVSSKTDLVAQVGTSGQDTALGRRQSILAKFEAGGTITSSNPEVPFAVPSTNIRPSFGKLAPLSLYPKNLGLLPAHDVVGMRKSRHHVTAKGVVQIKGARRTFVLDPSTMYGVKTWGVYQRTGPGKHDVRLLWTYKTSLPIPARLGFQAQAQNNIPLMLQDNFDTRLLQAIQTAR